MSGADDMLRLSLDISAASARVKVQSAQVMTKAMIDIQAGAQARAPVDTGALKNSITTELTGRGSKLRGEVGPTVHYGAFVENGTSRARAQPYLRPATDAVTPGYEAALEQLGAIGDD